ncbi:hypothetical protein E2C01_008821 [Portunus trituberculatus]|uniref:Uncharacterized protein n=1 Tax=Portunus trituberculatus TaxID=210409 RepID=A0A5B7D4T9_PORTR|nr:hypothetical protein [Portunus trituberculatus]
MVQPHSLTSSQDECIIPRKLLDDLAGNLAKLVRYYWITISVALQDGGTRVTNGSLGTQTRLKIEWKNTHNDSPSVSQAVEEDNL